MNSVQLSNALSHIDDELISESINLPDKVRLNIWQKTLAVAASIVIVLLGVCLTVSNIHNDPENIASTLSGKQYTSVDDIPVTKIGSNYLIGCNGSGPNHLFVVDGKFYFSIVTRWVGNDKTRQTAEYFTLFRYNPENGSCTAISDEVGYIHYSNGRFIYYRSDESVDARNLFSVPYYTNNALWNDEKQVDPHQAINMINSHYGSNAEKTNDGVKVTLNNNGTTYTIKPGLPAKSLYDVIGAAEEKLYLSVYTNDNQNSLYSIGLDGSNLSEIKTDDGTPVSGISAFIGDDGNVYAQNRGTTSTLIKIDPSSNKAILLAKVDGYVWDFVSNEEYAVCMVAGKSPAEPATLKTVKLSFSRN